MDSTHKDCIHHNDHQTRIVRNENDIQDLFKITDKMTNKIMWIVTGMTSLSLIGNYLIQLFGGK